jgi:hypothetical protein
VVCSSKEGTSIFDPSFSPHPTPLPSPQTRINPTFQFCPLGQGTLIIACESPHGSLFAMCCNHLLGYCTTLSGTALHCNASLVSELFFACRTLTGLIQSNPTQPSLLRDSRPILFDGWWGEQSINLFLPSNQPLFDFCRNRTIRKGQSVQNFQLQITVMHYAEARPLSSSSDCWTVDASRPFKCGANSLACGAAGKHFTTVPTYGTSS